MSEQKDPPEHEPEGLDAALEEVFGTEALRPDTSVLARLDPGGKVVSRILLRDEDSDPGQMLKPSPAGVALRTLDRYQVMGEIARGGVGVVLKGHDVDLGRDVAVKMLREEHAGRDDVLQRFVEEAQIGGQLQHPGIVPVYDLGLGEDQRPYFTMKLVKGRTLADLLAEREEPAKDRRRFLQIFEATCQTMAYAHARGVIHRDLKPANVMVGAFGEVLVVDWGMGKVLGRGGVADERKAKRPPPPDLSVIQTVRSEGTGSQSVVGSVMGTPRYMPPEQATGNLDQVDPRSDVFALGAILCEVLTGKPPYVGDEREVLQQAIRGQVRAALERLDESGADQDLVALAKACLSPAPTARPRDAGTVAKEIGAHLASLDEKALQAQLAAAAATEKAQGERRRRKLAVALAASIVGLVLLGAGGWAARHAELRRRSDEIARQVDVAIVEATKLSAKAAQADPEIAASLGREALAIARQANELAQSVDSDEGTRTRAVTFLADLEREEEKAKERATRHVRDEALVRHLEAIRIRFSEDLDRAKAGAACARAFAGDLGAAVASLPVEAVARRIEESDVGRDLRQVMDEWLNMYDSDSSLKMHLRMILDRVDPDPWGVGLQRQNVTVEALVRLAAQVDHDTLPTSNLAQLAGALGAMQKADDALPLALAAWQRAPGDFWICLTCGNVYEGLSQPDLEEAVRFYTAAVAARPRAFVAHFNLGNVLRDLGRNEESLSAYRRAVRLAPEQSGVHGNLGLVLGELGRDEEALSHAREAVRLDPTGATVRQNLGSALARSGLLEEAITTHKQAIRLDPRRAGSFVSLSYALLVAGRFDEAIEAAREAIELDPNLALAHRNLGAALAGRGRGLPGAIAAYREAVRLDPSRAGSHSGLGGALLAAGRWDEAIVACREASRLDPSLATAYDNLGSALLAVGRPEEAMVELQEALRLDPSNANTHYNIGNVHRTLGRHEEGIGWFRDALRLDPMLAEAQCNLAHTLAALGRHEEALTHFRLGHELGSRRPHWAYPSAAWVRNAELLVAASEKLPAVLEGREQPEDAAEAATLAVAAFQKGYYAAASRLRLDAFTAAPWLAEDIQSNHRYDAARAAALAAAGKGADVETLDDDGRAGWRKQAIDWLRADLELWGESDSVEAGLVVQTLSHWKTDPDLGGIRDPEKLTKLTADEQEACRELWRTVDELLERAREAAR